MFVVRMFRIRSLVLCSATNVKRQRLLMYRLFWSFVVVGKDLPPQNVVFGLADWPRHRPLMRVCSTGIV